MKAPSPISQSASSIPEVSFVLELGRTLQELGVGAPTLEKALERVAQHLGLEGAVYATPTGLLTSLRKEGLPSKTYLLRVETGGTNLDKLAEAEGLVDLVLEDRLTVPMAREHLARLSARPATFGPWVMAGAYAIAASGLANIFGGGWREMALGCLVGFLVGTAVIFAERRRSLARLSPLLGGLLSSLVGGLVGKFVPSASHPLLILCGIIVLVPGLGLLVSMQELGTGNLVSGTARMAGTGLVFLLLAFGVGLGQHLGGAWMVTAPSNPLPLPPWTTAPALALVALGFLVIFQGRLRDYGWTLAATLLAWGAAHLATRMLGPEAGAGIAALALGAACNQYAQRRRCPGAMLLLPSLMVILPGSLGMQGLTQLMRQQTLEGLQAGFQAFSVTVALMLGLLLANTMVPRRSF
jgi:uncharacterized membrane protein YjjP (DUF1212 family)